MNEKLLIFEIRVILVDMDSEKSRSRKSASAGISLEPDLKREAKQLARQLGFGSLSNYTRFLLTQELARARGEKSFKLNEESKPSGYDTRHIEGYSTPPRAENDAG
jgi:hypothetical protein